MINKLITNKPVVLALAFIGLMLTVHRLVYVYTPHAEWVTIDALDPPKPLPDPPTIRDEADDDV